MTAIRWIRETARSCVDAAKQVPVRVSQWLGREGPPPAKNEAPSGPSGDLLAPPSSPTGVNWQDRSPQRGGTHGEQREDGRHGSAPLTPLASDSLDWDQPEEPRGHVSARARVWDQLKRMALGSGNRHVIRNPKPAELKTPWLAGDIGQGGRVFVYAQAEGSPLQLAVRTLNDPACSVSWCASDVRLFQESWPAELALQPEDAVCQIVWGGESLCLPDVQTRVAWIEASRAAAILASDRQFNVDSPTPAQKWQVVVLLRNRIELHDLRVLFSTRSWPQSVVRTRVSVLEAPAPEIAAKAAHLMQSSNPNARWCVALSPCFLEFAEEDPKVTAWITTLAASAPGRCFLPWTLLQQLSACWRKHLELGDTAWPPDRTRAIDLCVARYRWGQPVQNELSVARDRVSASVEFPVSCSHNPANPATIEMAIRESGADSPPRRIQVTGPPGEHLAAFDICPSTGAVRVRLWPATEAGENRQNPHQVLWPFALAHTGREEVVAGEEETGVGAEEATSAETPKAEIPKIVCLALRRRAVHPEYVQRVVTVVTELVERGGLETMYVVRSDTNETKNELFRVTGEEIRNAGRRGCCDRLMEIGETDSGQPVGDLPDALNEIFASESWTWNASRGLSLLVIAESDFPLDPQSPWTRSAGRWSWSYNLERRVGTRLYWNACVWVQDGQDPEEAPLVGALQGLVFLGRQAQTMDHLVEYWRPFHPDTEEVAASVCAVADRAAHRFAHERAANRESSNTESGTRGNTTHGNTSAHSVFILGEGVESDASPFPSLRVNPSERRVSSSDIQPDLMESAIAADSDLNKVAARRLKHMLARLKSEAT